MLKLLLTKLIEHKKLHSESKLQIYYQLLMLIKQQEMMPPHTESMLKVKFKLPKNISLD